MKRIFKPQFIIPGCFLVLLFYLFLFPAQAFHAACNGLDLWFHTLLPSLLPFCILSNILIVSEIIPKLLKPFQPVFRMVFGLSSYGSYALVLGLLCGYPMGAKIVGDLYRQKKITQQEGNYLLTISNHASPMFITTYISLHLFENRVSLSKTFLILYSSAFLTSLFFRLYFYTRRNMVNITCQAIASTRNTRTIQKSPAKISLPTYSGSDTKSSCSISIETVDDAIFNGFETITKLGGYLILFSICSSMLQQLLEPIHTLQWFLPGITELTTGINLIAKTTMDFKMKYAFILTFTSFGGLSTIAQTKGMLYSTPFQISTYIIGKTGNALCTFALTLLFFVF